MEDVGAGFLIGVYMILLDGVGVCSLDFIFLFINTVLPQYCLISIIVGCRIQRLRTEVRNIGLKQVFTLQCTSQVLFVGSKYVTMCEFIPHCILV